MDRKRKEHLQELYAAWDTTREEHMALMMKLVDCLNADVEKEEEAAISGPIVRMTEPAKGRAAAAKPSAVTDKLSMVKSVDIVDRLKERMAKDKAVKDKKSAVMKIAAKRKPTSPDTIEIEGVGLNVECLKEGSPLMMKATEGKPNRLRHGKTKSSLRNQGSKSTRVRRRR